MNTIFDYINYILFSKDKSKFSSIDHEQSFQPYMVNRWISMHSPELGTVVNTTTNKYINLFKNKKDLFNFYISIYPRLKFKRIKYIKKVKAEKIDEEAEKDICLIAQSLELSQREIRMYQDMLDS